MGQTSFQSKYKGNSTIQKLISPSLQWTSWWNKLQKKKAWKTFQNCKRVKEKFYYDGPPAFTTCMSPEKIVLEGELPFYTKLNSYFTSSLIIKPQVSFQPPPQGCETGVQNKLTLSFQATCSQRSPEINCKLLEINEDPVLNAAHSPGETQATSLPPFHATSQREPEWYPANANT